MSEDADARAERGEIEGIRAALEAKGGVVGLAAHLNRDIVEASGLDMRTFFLVRAAAMAAMGSGPSGWEITTELMDPDVTAEDLMGMLTAIAPIIGTARLLTATENLLTD